MNDAKKYLRTIRHLLPVYSSYEKRFYSDFKNAVTEHMLLFPDSKFADLECAFGVPKIIICDYFSTVDKDYLSKCMSKIRYIRIIVFCIVFCCVLALSVWSGFIYKSYRDFQDALPAIEETTIIIDNQK